MEDDGKDRRRYPRNVFTETIEFTSVLNKDAPVEMVTKGIAINVSLSGLCMYIFTPLNNGQQLKIMKGLSTSRPVLASVRWMTQIAENMYKTGLAFH